MYGDVDGDKVGERLGVRSMWTVWCDDGNMTYIGADVDNARVDCGWKDTVGEGVALTCDPGINGGRELVRSCSDCVYRADVESAGGGPGGNAAAPLSVETCRDCETGGPRFEVGVGGT